MSLQGIQIHDLVQAKLYENDEQAIQDALRYMLLERPDLRIQVAIHRYRVDETLSLAQAAAIAGVSFERMKEILERYSVPLRLGPANLDAARAEAADLETWFDANTD